MPKLRLLRAFLAAALTNFCMGLLYCWTLFSKAVAPHLNVTATTISSLPSLSLLRTPV